MAEPATASHRFGHVRLADFPLEPGVLHLNHGSFGAVPHRVLAAQAHWRQRMEANPMLFFLDETPPLLRRSAESAARFLGGEGKDWVLLENATAGINAVLHSLNLGPDDEILHTDHGYGAVTRALENKRARDGVRLVAARLPMPLDADGTVDAVMRAISDETRLIVIDQITSPSGAILPVGEIAQRARMMGIRVLVDGAHVPGQLPVDVPAIGADWWVGNAHKWLFAPRGCALMWVAPEAQAGLEPATISHGYGQGLATAFDWTGTRDLTPFLCLDEAIAAFHDFGGEALIQRNAAMARMMGEMLAARLKARLACSPGLTPAMAALELPFGGTVTPEVATAFRRALRTRGGIEAAVNAFAGGLWLRISVQAYTAPADYVRLAETVETILAEGL